MSRLSRDIKRGWLSGGLIVTMFVSGCVPWRKPAPINFLTLPSSIVAELGGARLALTLFTVRVRE